MRGAERAFEGKENQGKEGKKAVTVEKKYEVCDEDVFISGFAVPRSEFSFSVCGQFK